MIVRRQSLRIQQMLLNAKKKYEQAIQKKKDDEQSKSKENDTN